MTKALYCGNCKLEAKAIQEYAHAAKLEGCSPEEFVLREEGTLNRELGIFWCTECYITLGMPLGVAQ